MLEAAREGMDPDVRPQDDLFGHVNGRWFDEVEIPQRWLPDGAIRDISDLTGRVSSAPLREGTLLQQANLIPRPTLEAGQREIAIMINAETGVAGKIQPGNRVDVWATFGDDITGTGARTKVIAENLLVIDVGTPVMVEEQTTAGGFAAGEAVPVTFATEEGQVKALTFAESFAVEIRLVRRPPGDDTSVAPESKTYAETFDRRGGKS
jgi:pilus assembly protein CpaB